MEMSYFRTRTLAVSQRLEPALVVSEKPLKAQKDALALVLVNLTLVRVPRASGPAHL